MKTTSIKDDAYGMVGDDALLVFVSDELSTPDRDSVVAEILANLSCENHAHQTITPGGVRCLDPRPTELVLDYGESLPIPGQEQWAPDHAWA